MFPVASFGLQIMCVSLMRLANVVSKVAWRHKRGSHFQQNSIVWGFHPRKKCTALKPYARFRPKCVCRFSAVQMLLDGPFLWFKNVCLAPVPCTFPNWCSPKASAALPKAGFASRWGAVHNLDQNMPGVQAWRTTGARVCGASHSCMFPSVCSS